MLPTQARKARASSVWRCPDVCGTLGACSDERNGYGDDRHGHKGSGLPTGSVTLVDDETTTWIDLPPDLPDKAWRLLLGVR